MSVAPDDAASWQSPGGWAWQPIVPASGADGDDVVVDLSTRLHLVPSPPERPPPPPAPPSPPPPPPVVDRPVVVAPERPLVFGGSDVLASTPAAAPSPSEPRRDLRVRRTAIVVALVAIAVVIPIDLLVGRVVHDQRQRHLAHDVQAGTRSVAPGEALAVLQIPAIGFNQVVIEGASAGELRSGPGHVLGTAEPGHAGNIVIVGHRTRYEGPFGDLSALAEGAKVAIRTRTGEPVRFYAVDRVRRVDSDDPSPLRRTKDEQLTLVTAASGLSPDRLLVVTAKPTDPTTPATKAAKGIPDQNALDGASSSMPLGLALLLVLVAAAAVAAFLVWRRFAGRYSPITVAAVLLPAAAVVLLVLLGIADAVLPSLV